MKEKLKNNKIAVIVAAAACVCIVLLCIIFVSSGRKNPLQEQLDLGNRYLDELNYDAALASFLAAIEIDPKNPEGYAGAAEAYVGLGDLENAVDILRQGYERTQDAGLAERLEELEQKLQEAREQEEKERLEREEKERQEQEARKQEEKERQEQEEKEKEVAATGSGEVSVVEVPETDDPLVEFIFAPYAYASELLPYNIEDVEAAASFAAEQGIVGDEGNAVLSGGQEYHFWRGEAFDEFHDIYNGTLVELGVGSTYTSYEYVDGVLDQVYLYFPMEGRVEPGDAVGGFSDFAIKYGCTSLEDFLRAVGIEDEELYIALSQDNSGYEGELETPYGTVMVGAFIYSFGDAFGAHRYVTLTFEEDSGAPWAQIQLGDGLIWAMKGYYAG